MSRRLRPLWLFFSLLTLVGLACNLAGTPTPTVVPPPATLAVAPPPTVDIITGTLPAAATVTNTITLAPTLAAPGQNGETPGATAAIADETPAETMTAVPLFTAVAGERLAPGQRDTATLAAGAFRVYPFQGTAFEPVLLFVETADTLDVIVAAYAGQVEPDASLSNLAPEAEADFSQAGGPEILVFTPGDDGLYSFVVHGQGTGEYTLYLFDARTSSPNVVVQQAGSLMAGATSAYGVQSNGGRPVLVWVTPEGQVDLTVQIRDSNGNMVQDANYSGRGSAEAVFVLPLQTTQYTVTIGEATGTAADYRVAIIALD